MSLKIFALEKKNHLAPPGEQRLEPALAIHPKVLTDEPAVMNPMKPKTDRADCCARSFKIAIALIEHDTALG